MNLEDHYLKCPFCGHQTNIAPEFMLPDDPMLYCPECDRPLIIDYFEDNDDDDPNDSRNL